MKNCFTCNKKIKEGERYLISVYDYLEQNSNFFIHSNCFTFVRNNEDYCSKFSSPYFEIEENFQEKIFFWSDTSIEKFDNFNDNKRFINDNKKDKFIDLIVSFLFFNLIEKYSDDVFIDCKEDKFLKYKKLSSDFINCILKEKIHEKEKYKRIKNLFFLINVFNFFERKKKYEECENCQLINNSSLLKCDECNSFVFDKKMIEKENDELGTIKKIEIYKYGIDEYFKKDELTTEDSVEDGNDNNEKKDELTTEDSVEDGNDNNEKKDELTTEDSVEDGNDNNEKKDELINKLLDVNDKLIKDIELLKKDIELLKKKFSEEIDNNIDDFIEIEKKVDNLNLFWLKFFSFLSIIVSFYTFFSFYNYKKKKKEIIWENQ